MSDITAKSWEEFRNSQLLWWVNRSLHLFGWAIVLKQNDNGKLEAFPAKVNFRGFTQEREEMGFIKLTDYLIENMKPVNSNTEGK